MNTFVKKPLVVAIGLALAGSQLLIAAEAEDEQLAEVTVTGSRIQLSAGMTTPTPVAELKASDLQAMQPSSVTAALTQLPQFAGQSATSENFGTLAAADSSTARVAVR